MVVPKTKPGEVYFTINKCLKKLLRNIFCQLVSIYLRGTGPQIGIHVSKTVRYRSLFVKVEVVTLSFLKHNRPMS